MTPDPAAMPPARHPLAVPVVTLLAAAGVILDQATKLVAERILDPGVFVPLLGDGVGWQLIGNPGAAFGMPVPAPLFLVVTALVVFIVVRSLRTTASLLQASAYGLLLAGAVGNLIDRVLRAGEGFLSGEVVDFVAWGSFPRFNVADSWITVGFALLVIALLIEDRRVAAAERAAAEADAASASTADGTAEAHRTEGT
ncbi:MAG: signal peptidase II [Nitriliruptor sp.]|uniref:signal peptidase II n=1 Tax=Nitriliruptor sp. TaxID=2448056 RepID=UPI0034A04C08